MKIKFLISAFLIVFYAQNACAAFQSIRRTYTTETTSCSTSINKKGMGPAGFNAICTDNDGNQIFRTGNDFNYIAYDENGNVYSEYNYYSPRPTYILNQDGQVVGKKNGFNGPLVEEYKYTDSGKLLAYRVDGTFIGVYNDILDYHMVSQAGSDGVSPNYQGLSRYVNNLNLIDEDGNFYDYAADGKTLLGVYKQNGDITTYKYDAGGNLMQVYENGKQIYSRRIYTVEEASRAVKKDRNTFKLRYR